MTDTSRRSLAPMEAIEFAIAAVFRHFFFGLRLVLGWLAVLSPLVALVWYAALRNGMADWAALPLLAKATLAALTAGALLAALSIAVNWQRRILSGESPRGLGWLRLDGAVWRFFGGLLLVLIVLGLYAAAGYAVMSLAVPALEPRLGPAARPMGIATTALLGLSALFTVNRMSGRLAAIAVEDDLYTFRAAWAATRGNRFAYLGFTFWLMFTLAILGAAGAGLFFAQSALPQPWVKPSAFAIIGLLAWLAAFLLASVPAAQYRNFSGRGGR